MNMEKTKARNIGTPITADHDAHGLTWIKTPLETLGIYMPNNPEENLNYNLTQTLISGNKEI